MWIYSDRDDYGGDALGAVVVIAPLSPKRITTNYRLAGKTRVIILGGGFGGLYAALEFEKRNALPISQRCQPSNRRRRFFAFRMELAADSISFSISSGSVGKNAGLNPSKFVHSVGHTLSILPRVRISCRSRIDCYGPTSIRKKQCRITSGHRVEQSLQRGILKSN